MYLSRKTIFKNFIVPVCVLALTGCGLSQAGAELSGEKDGVSLTADWKEYSTDISPELFHEGSMETEYAQNFAIDYYEDGYILLTVADGSRFLVVPENTATPKELAEDIVVLERPVENLYLVASAVMDMFRELDALDSIRFSGQKADGWYIEEAVTAMEEGDILYAGKYSMPDYELILSEGCSLAIENTMIFHSPEVVEKLESFGIPVLVDYSSYEPHPLGRVEWIRFYGALLGKEEAAGEAFQAQAEVLERIAAEEGSDQTVAFFYITSNGAVNVRSSSDYVPKMIELAGGRYIFGDLGEENGKKSSVTMQMEEFYKTAIEADYIIYNSTIDGEIVSVEELLAKSEVLKDFRAVQEGNVFCTTNDLYQQSMSIGVMIEDIHNMLTGDADRQKEMKYIYPLQQEDLQITERQG